MIEFFAFLHRVVLRDGVRIFWILWCEFSFHSRMTSESEGKYSYGLETSILPHDNLYKGYRVCGKYIYHVWKKVHTFITVEKGVWRIGKFDWTRTKYAYTELQNHGRL